MAEDSVMSKSIRSVHDAKHVGNVIIACEEMVSLLSADDWTAGATFYTRRRASVYC